MKFAFPRFNPGWNALASFLCGLFLAVLPAAAQTERVINEIKIQHIGPPAASEPFIRAQIRVKPGDTWNLSSVDDDVRSLLSTRLFHDVVVEGEPANGGINLIYKLQGRPTLTEIRFEGNSRFKDSRLRKRVTSKIGEPLDERKLFLDQQEILKFYQKAGHQKTEVKYLPYIDTSTGRATVTFEIDEAPRVRIEQVEFVGASAFSQRKLRKVIKTRRHWFMSWITGSGKFKDEQFADDRERLREFYQNEGYIDFEIEDIQFDYPDPRHMIIRFFVNEGKQYRVGHVGFKDNTIFTDEEILNGVAALGRNLKLDVGEVFSPANLSHDVEAIRDFYGSKGYIDAWIRPLQVANVETGTMDLVYEINDEPRGPSYIERIEIRGNTKTKDKVIRRELAVAPGELFDIVRVKRSRNRLLQMQYFDRVETEPEPTDVPHLKNLIIDVEEGSTGSFEMGAGFSTVDNLVGFVGYREGNFDLFNPPYFRGGGQKLRVYAQLGTRRQDYVISFTEPWFLDRRLAFGTDLYYRELGYFSDIYDINQAGARLSLTKALGSEFLIGGISYTIENLGIRNVDQDRAPLVIRLEPKNRLVTKFGATLAYDTRNSVTLPDSGQRSELITELAGPFGGDTDFYKFELRSSWYFPGFLQGHVLEVGGRGGVVNEYGRTDRVPLFDRFHLGGVWSLRGYRYRQIGPHQEGEPIGGETYWFGTVEYSVPIIERLRFAIFYDIGNVYEDAFSFDRLPGQRFYNDNWGLGLRLNIPRLGPLRLDYAFPITHDEYLSGKGRFQFSVGFARDF